MAKPSHKTIVISILNNLKNKDLPILILKMKILIFGIKEIDIGIIDVNIYWIAYKFKKAQIFILSMRNLEYQIEKKS